MKQIFFRVVTDMYHISSGLPRCGELRTQKLKSNLMRTQSLKVLPLKPGVGQYIAVHATLTARDFFLANFYPSGPFTCIFSKPLLIFPVLAVANTWGLHRNHVLVTANTGKIRRGLEKMQVNGPRV